jgi:hypothetical protein
MFVVTESSRIRVTCSLPGKGQAGTYISRRCPVIYNLSFYNLRDQFLTGCLFIPRSIVAVVTEPLPSYQQILIVCFCGYESCTCCLATAMLEHTYFLRYFGPLGKMPYFSLFILFLILIQSGKRGKWNYTIHGKIVMPEHTYIHTYINFYVDRWLMRNTKVSARLLPVRK